MKYILTGLIAVGMSALMAVLLYQQQPKTAFVDNQRLFDAFEGKQELEVRLEQGAQAQQAVLDSLRLQLTQLERLAQTDEAARQRFLPLQQRYQQQQQIAAQDYQTQSRDYTDAIWKQLSRYTLEYGAEHDYDYIFGTAAQGSLMYGAAKRDITDAVILYINQRYAGQ